MAWWKIPARLFPLFIMVVLEMHAHAALADQAPPPALRAQPPADGDGYAYFTSVGSFWTEAGAMRHLSDLRRKQLDLVAAVLPPFGNGRYWTVATAVYAHREAARAQARFARQQGLQHDAFVWRVPLSRLARLSSPYAVTAASVAMPAYPDLLMPPRGAAADEDRYFVFLGNPGTEEEIVGAGQVVRTKYPGINVAAFPPLEPGGLWRLAIAAHASQAQASEALEVANRLGLVSPDGVVGLKASSVRSWFDKDPVLLAQEQEVRAKLDSCYRAGKVTVGAMLDCSGYLVTPRILASCLGGNQREDGRSDIEAVPAMRETCTAMMPDADSWEMLRLSSISGETLLEISRELLPKIPGGQDLPDLMDCKAQAGDDQPKLMECMLPKLTSEEQMAQLKCAQKSSEEEIYACVRGTITDEETLERLDCLKDGTGAAGGWEKCLVPPEASAAVESVTACTTAATSQEEFATKCLSMLTSDDKALRTARCAYEAGTDRAAVLRCLAEEDEGVSKVLGVVECVDGYRDDRVALTKCLASKGGGSTAAAVACLSDSTVDPISCINTRDPKIEQAQRIYSCAKSAGDVAAMIETCGSGIGDAKTRQAAACLARANGDRAEMAACAGQALLPGDLGRVAGCAASSQGTVSFAICASGAQMNEEWRIAAECAAQSGGEPVTFATCAGGRLTVRELTKCLTGEFGKDCFGPNNTIVKYYTGAFNDMKNLLGGRWSEFENNDVVKTGKALINFAEDAGEAVEKTLNDAKEVFGREVNAEKVREWVNDPVGSYQRSDVGREINPEKVKGWVEKPGESWERGDLNPKNWF